MRFFKYLIFTFLSFLSAAVNAAWWIDGKFYDISDHRKAAEAAGYGPAFAVSCTAVAGGYNCSSENKYFSIRKEPPQECWHPDYKIVTQSITGQIKKSICVPNNGVMCKYTSSTINNAPIVNNSITTTFSSVSKTPDPNCQEDLLNPPCDPKDPYGGCYTPPNQECTRQFDGSIVCPEEKEPPIQKGCNGADYCDRPPEGCGQGYVSGKYNGKLICIKTTPSTDNPQPPNGDSGNTGDGTGTSTTTGTETTTTTTTNADGSTSTSTSTTTINTTTINNFKIDLSGVIAAVNAVSAQLSSLKNELLSSLNDLSSKLDSTNSKIDATNSKLDTSNTHLSNINDSNLRQEQLLKDIRDKTNSDQPPSGSSTDLTETNGLLGEIRDGINDIKNVFSDEGKDQLEQLGQESNDSRYISAEANAQSSLNALANKLTFSNSACVSDFQIRIPKFGSINIALSQWCGLLALLKILIHLAVLLTCLRMVDATVRTI